MTETAFTVGVLALQGDVREHLRSIEKCGARPVTVKHKEDLADLDGLVLPGGESTAIAILLSHEPGFLDALKVFTQTRPTWGTCAGMVMLASELTSSSAKKGGQPLIGGLKVCVDRNHYGSQCQSFESAINVTDAALDANVKYPFIRAPYIQHVLDPASVQCLAFLSIDGQSDQDHPVAVLQGHLLATSFHPELVGDEGGSVWLSFFLKLIAKYSAKS